MNQQSFLHPSQGQFCTPRQRTCCNFRDFKRYTVFVDRFFLIVQELTKPKPEVISNSYFVTHLIPFSGLEGTNNHFYTLHRASSVHPDSRHGVIQGFQALHGVRRPLLFHSSRTHETQTGNDIKLWLCTNFILLPCLEWTDNHFYTSCRANSLHPDSGHGVIQGFQALCEVRRPLRFHSSRTHKTQIGSGIKLLLCHTLYTFPRSRKDQQSFLHSSQGQFCTPRQRSWRDSEISSALRSS